MPLLARVGLAVRVDGEVPRVESFDRAPDRTALPAGVDPFDDDEQTGADRAAVGLTAEFEAQREEPLLCGGEPLLVLVPVES